VKVGFFFPFSFTPVIEDPWFANDRVAFLASDRDFSPAFPSFAFGVFDCESADPYRDRKRLPGL